MTCPIDTHSAAATRIFRLCRRPNAWTFPDWSFAAQEGSTFGNRWDDPRGVYRVLYACKQRPGTFAETLARFRPDPRVAAALAQIDGDEDVLGPGFLPRSWLANRVIGEATVDGTFAAIGRESSLSYLRESMAASLVRYGVEDLDAATIRSSAPRAFTQEISRAIYECTGTGDRREFDGIYYLSKLGDNFENLAIFEPASLKDELNSPVYEDDPDFQDIIERFRIVLFDE